MRTREPDPPAHRSGVLCIDAVEISTNGGHYVAIGLPTDAMSARAATLDDVVEDVARLGGIRASRRTPIRPSGDLRWGGWVGALRRHRARQRRHRAGASARAPLDLPGVDVGSSRCSAAYPWRDLPRRSRRLLTDDAERPSTAGSICTRAAPIVAVAGHDAHAQIGLWEFDPIDTPLRAADPRLPDQPSDLCRCTYARRVR